MEYRVAVTPAASKRGKVNARVLGPEELDAGPEDITYLVDAQDQNAAITQALGRFAQREGIVN